MEHLSPPPTDEGSCAETTAGRHLLHASLLGTCLLATSALASCATSSVEYVEKAQLGEGFAMSRGRVLRVEALSSSAIARLADGIAVELARPGRITLSFGEAERDFELAPGAVVVFGAEGDFVLQPQGDSTAADGNGNGGAGDGEGPGGRIPSAPESEDDAR